jgi:hypothetical protein
MPNEQLGAYTVPVAQAILDDYKARNGAPEEYGASPVRKPLDFIPPQPTPIYFRNDSGVTIPPWGLVQPTGTYNETNSFCYVKVDRPIGATLMRCPLLINGPYECLDGDYGCAQQGPVFRLLHDGGTYVAGDRLGAKTGTFTATYGALYAVIGPDAIDTNIVRVMFDTSPFYGKTKSSGLTAATPANVYVYDAAGTLTSKEYLAETRVTDIAGDAEILLIPTFGRLFASRIC